ncbi:MAG: PilZ domain-containing protein [Nakamurella sp.]
MSAETTVALPSAGHSVELHELGGRSSLGRVQAATAETIVVALPIDAGIAASTGIGAQIRVVWPGRGGVMSVPTTLARRQRAPQLDMWELTPIHPAQFEQRRHQPRIPVSGGITLTIDPDLDSSVTDPATLSGTLVDLSESAVQCLINIDAEDAVVSSGTLGLCEFSFAGSKFSLRGEVHAAWTEDAPSCIRVVVQFDPDQSELVALARAVMDGVETAGQQ